MLSCIHFPTIYDGIPAGDMEGREAIHNERMKT